MFFRAALKIVVVATLATSCAVAGDSKSTLKTVGDGVICQCGCNETVNNCNHYNCSSATEMRALIQKESAEGKDEAAIFQDLALRYGVKVLASPPARGFNLVVWILPGLGLVVGLGVVIVLARRWRGPARAPAHAPHVRIDPQLLAAVEEEMKKVMGS